MTLAGTLRYRRPGTRSGRPPRRKRTGGPARSGPHQRRISQGFTALTRIASAGSATAPPRL